MIIIPHYREKHCFPAEVNSPLVCLDHRSANFYNTCRTKSATKLYHIGTQACEVDIYSDLCISKVMLLQYVNSTSLPVVATLGLSAPIYTPNYLSLSMHASTKTGFGHDTFGENHLYLAWNQARQVISAGHH